MSDFEKAVYPEPIDKVIKQGGFREFNPGSEDGDGFDLPTLDDNVETHLIPLQKQPSKQ